MIKMLSASGRGPEEVLSECSRQVLGALGAVGLLQVRCRKYDRTV